MNAVLEKPARKSRAAKAMAAPVALEPVATEELAADVGTITSSAVTPKQFSQELLKKLYWEAFVCMTNAFSVLLHYAQHVDDTAVLAMKDLLEVYLAEAEPRPDEHGDVQDYLSDLSADLSKILALVDAHAMSNHDNVMHGVSELLGTARRIADGDKGVLDA